MAQSLTGVVLKDKWRIDTLLGEGGVAAVYAATHRNGKRVAVKILHPHLASIPEVRERFMREGYLANRIEHPGAVGVIDDDVTEDGLVFLVMELLVGESLEKRLQREMRLPPADVLAIAEGLLEVLAAAHAKGIVHRDIKPENIYLLRDGGQRLLDFGIARLHEQTAARNATQSGAVMGTPSYMPPEQARGRWEVVDARSDLWAVGATMFALLVGRCVHEAETVNETLLRAMTQPAEPLAHAWPGAPPAVATIVDRALAFEIADRWSDAEAMLRAVREARERLASEPAPTARTMLAPEARTAVPSTPRVTPPGGTLLVGTRSEHPPAQTSTPTLLASTRARVALGGGVAAVAVVTFLLLSIAHRPGSAPASVAASFVPSLPSAPSLSAESLTPLPSATASTPDDVGSAPPAVVSASSIAPPPVLPASRPRPPVSAASTVPRVPSMPAASVPPPSSLLDRRH